MVAVEFDETDRFLYLFFRLWKSYISEKLSDFVVLGAIPCGVMVLPQNSTSITPKWHFSIVNLIPAFLMQSKTARMLRNSYITEFRGYSNIIHILRALLGFDHFV